MAEMVVIVDSYGRVTDSGVEYVDRGKSVDLDGAELVRATDAKIHPPYGAVAKVDSLLAGALSDPVPPHIDPATTRARLDALYRLDQQGYTAKGGEDVNAVADAQLSDEAAEPVENDSYSPQADPPKRRSSAKTEG